MLTIAERIAAKRVEIYELNAQREVAGGACWEAKADYESKDYGMGDTPRYRTWSDSADEVISLANQCADLINELIELERIAAIGIESCHPGLMSGAL